MSFNLINGKLNGKALIVIIIILSSLTGWALPTAMQKTYVDHQARIDIAVVQNDINTIKRDISEIKQDVKAILRGK